MNLQAPPGSAIQTILENGSWTIVVPAPRKYGRIWFAGAFLLVWLAIWAFGWALALMRIFAGDRGLFMLIWIAGWTVGGAVATALLFGLLRPVAPEKLALTPTGVAYDSGGRPFEYLIGRRSVRWAKAFPKRIRTIVDRDQLWTLRLHGPEGAGRLTVDVGAESFDIARYATSAERIWINRVIRQFYRMPLA